MLSRTEVEHIARLARLALTEEEKERFRVQLSAILEYAARLQELDTSDVPPTFSVMVPKNVFREDVPQEGLGLEDLLANAPQVEGRQFVIPPVFD